MTMFRAAVARYHAQPQSSTDHFFLPEEGKFLSEIGYKESEMYAYIQAYATTGDPSPSTVLLIAAMRRSFFITSQRGIFGNAKPVTEEDLPSETDDYQGIAYLPRMIRKAEAKLHGTLGEGLMYYCERDREFLRTHGEIHPADFLHLTWTAHGDKQRMITAVINAMRASQAAAGVRAKSAPMPEAVQSELQLD